MNLPALAMSSIKSRTLLKFFGVLRLGAALEVPPDSAQSKDYESGGKPPQSKKRILQWRLEVMSKTAPVSQSRAKQSSSRGESHPIPEHIIREFVGNLRLNTVHNVTSRLVVMSEIAEGLLAGELNPDYHDRLRAATRELTDEQASPFIKSLIAAIEQGEEGLRALMSATNQALHLAANYIASKFSESELEEIGRLRLAVFRQRQKHRLKRAKRLGRLKASALFVPTGGCERLN